jgi:hypothetical protein
VLEAVLRADGGDAKYELEGVLENVPCGRVDEGHVGVKPLKEGGDVACQGMTGREAEARREERSEWFKRGKQLAALFLCDLERACFWINGSRVYVLSALATDHCEKEGAGFGRTHYLQPRRSWISCFPSGQTEATS